MYSSCKLVTAFTICTVVTSICDAVNINTVGTSSWAIIVIPVDGTSNSVSQSIKYALQ